jgi:hypothetical protein
MKSSENRHDIYYIAWMDNKPVHMLSTFEPFLSTADRRGFVNGQYQLQNIRMPSQIQAYNHGMGGTDLNDQYATYYNLHHRSWSWIRRVYAHFLQVVARNSHILYKESPRTNAAEPKLPHLLDFLKVLVAELMQLPNEAVEEQKDDDGIDDEDEPDFDDEDFDIANFYEE